MTGEVKPAGTQENAPAMTAEEAAVAAANTKVHEGGREYDVTNLPVNTGLEIYNVLPKDAQAQAQQIATVMRTFASVQDIASKHGLDCTEVAKDWLASVGNTDAGKAAAAKFSDAQKQAVAEMNNLGISADSLAAMVPGGSTLLGAARVGGVVTGSAGAVISGLSSGGVPFWELCKTMGRETFGQIFGYGSGTDEKPALAFASAVVALRREEQRKRHDLPMWDWNPTDDKESQIGSNPLQYGKAGFSWVGQKIGNLGVWMAEHLPFADTVIAAYRYLFDNDQKLNWEQLKQQARNDIETWKKTPASADDKSFDELADAAMWDKEGETVKNGLLKAKKVADVDTTTGAAEVATAPVVTVRNENGVDVTLDHGKVVKEVTSGERMKGAWKGLVGDGPWYEQGLRGGATVAGGGVALAVVTSKPALAAYGLVEGAVKDSNHKAAEVARFKAEEKVRALQERIDSPKEHWWQFRRATTAEIPALEKQLEAAKEEAVKLGKEAHDLRGTSKFLNTAAKPMAELNQEMKLFGFNIHPKLAAAINFPRGLMRRIGGGMAHVVEGVDGVVGQDAGTGGFWSRTKHFFNLGSDIEPAASTLGKSAQFLGRWGTKGMAALTPVSAGGQALADIGQSDGVGATLHTTEAVGTGVALAKIGVGRAVPWFTPVASTVEFANAARKGDSKGMWSAGKDLGIVGSFAGAGALLGLAGGPFAAVTSPAGAAVGATVGGFAVAGRHLWNLFSGGDAPQVVSSANAAEPKAPQKPAAPAKNVELSPEWAKAHDEAIRQAQMAVKRGGSKPLGGFNVSAFAKIQSNSAGAIISGGGAPQGTSQQNAATIS